MFNVGDKVTIRQDLIAGNYYGADCFVEDMIPMLGREVTIKFVYDDENRYLIKEFGYNWTPEMFVQAETETETEKEERPMVEHTAVTQIDRDDVLKNMYKTLEICDIYHPTDYGMNAILDRWEDEKGTADVWEGNSVIDILSKHPDYVPEKGYIVKKKEYDRGVDPDVIMDVLDSLIAALCYPVGNCLVDEVKLYPFTYKEVCDYMGKLRNIIVTLDSDAFFTYRGMKASQIREEYEQWKNRKHILENTYIVEGYRCFDREAMNKISKLRKLISDIKNWAYAELSCKKENEPLLEPVVIDDLVLGYIEQSELPIRGIRAGQKLNKVINKILTETGVKDKWSEYNRQTARLGEAASPLKFTKYTIISANPVDYLRMSFGKSWKSCHTPDKKGYYRPSDGGEGYSGMHASGTLSYLQDSSSVVMYTVDEKYDGKDYEMEPKLERCMFHLGEGKFVMGRVYPQGTDGAKEVYVQWRNIFQQIIAECMGVPNYWRTNKERDEKLRQIWSTGTHYRDYEYGYCDIAGWSYLKPDADTKPSERKINIGSYPICPCCGNEHEVEDNLECKDCNDDSSRHRCADCGECYDEEDMIYIDGEWYCHDCVDYCEYHDEYERGELTYVQDYGYVCDDALDSGDFIECEQCGNYYYACRRDGITTQDGSWYCCEYCAGDAGYVEAYDGEWYDEDETHCCNECGKIVPDDEWDDEMEMCCECAAARQTEENIA